ncbi:ABC transporter ATP-binding protein, partial [Myxococcota bacterium]|nr:ABC transporter ATP-binding protein [Myxococcota bacterium]
RRGQNAQGDINAVSYEALAGVRVVQAFGTEKREAEKLDAAAGRYYQQMLRSYFIRAVRTPTMEIMGAFALAALLGFLGYRVRDTGADPAHFISFFVAIVMMYDPLKRLGRVSDYLAAGSAAGDRLFEVMDAPRDIEDAPDAIEAAPFQDKVVFENIHFAYNNEPVLRGISLQLKQGDIVALVGASGSGKTTLANLLPRFYDIKEGSLRLDDVELKTLKIDSLRKQISVVSQDTFLFNLSIAENIAYGSPKASEQDIVQAAKSAYADEFITRLENGYDTVIGERGMTLSGGQRQRVAIARSILRNAPILILDEATSALDIESERFVQNALEQLMKDRTSLVIAHRLSTVRRADIIYVLKEGQIAESGKHDELLAKGGEYARLYEMQFDSTDNEPQSAALTA